MHIKAQWRQSNSEQEDKQNDCWKLEASQTRAVIKDLIAPRPADCSADCERARSKSERGQPQEPQAAMRVRVRGHQCQAHARQLKKKKRPQEPFPEIERQQELINRNADQAVIPA